MGQGCRAAVTMLAAGLADAWGCRERACMRDADCSVRATCGWSMSACWACTTTAGPCWLRQGALSGRPSGTAARGSGHPHRSANTAVFSTSSSLMLKSATARYLSSSSTMSAALLVLHMVNSRSRPCRRMLTSASRRLATMLFWCLQQVTSSKSAGKGTHHNSGACMHKFTSQRGLTSGRQV